MSERSFIQVSAMDMPFEALIDLLEIDCNFLEEGDEHSLLFQKFWIFNKEEIAKFGFYKKSVTTFVQLFVHYLLSSTRLD
jgi:hypothetical protein